KLGPGGSRVQISRCRRVAVEMPVLLAGDIGTKAQESYGICDSLIRGSPSIHDQRAVVILEQPYGVAVAVSPDKCGPPGQRKRLRRRPCPKGIRSGNAAWHKDKIGMKAHRLVWGASWRKHAMPCRPDDRLILRVHDSTGAHEIAAAGDSKE